MAEQLLRFVQEESLIQEADHSANNVGCSSDITAAVNFPAIDTTTTTTDLPCYDNSYELELISSVLNSLPPPEPELDIFPSYPVASMAPMHPMDELNPMNHTPPFTTYHPTSVVSQLPLDPLGLPAYMGMGTLTMQRCPIMDANGGMAGEMYANGMGMPTCATAKSEMGIYPSVGMSVENEMEIYPIVGMPMSSLETPEACSLRGLYSYGAMPNLYDPRNFQVLGDGQQIRPGCSTSTAPLQVPSDIPAMDDSENKVRPITGVERQEKLDKYLRKRKVRNFNKTIKYACRKTLADSRPRIRGRFAKNEEFREVAPSCANGGYEHCHNGHEDQSLLRIHGPISQNILAYKLY